MTPEIGKAETQKLLFAWSFKREVSAIARKKAAKYRIHRTAHRSKRNTKNFRPVSGLARFVFRFTFPCRNTVALESTLSFTVAGAASDGYSQLSVTELPV